MKSQDVNSKYLHSEKNYFTLLNVLKEKFHYKKFVIPFILYLLLKTGMKYRELIVITWKVVDLVKGFVKTYRRYNSEINKFVPPKNKTSIRTIQIAQDCVEVLKILHQEQELTNKELGF